MALAGNVALWVAVIAAIWSGACGVAGVVTRDESFARVGAWSMPVALAGLLFATATLLAALVRSDFGLVYVATHTTLNLPAAYKLGAMWAGQAGSMLGWCALFSVVAVLGVFVARRAAPASSAWATSVLAVTLSLFVLLSAIQWNPFERLPSPVPEGGGLPAALQRPAVLAHIPMLFLGFALTAVPLALVTAGLAGRDADGRWALEARRWTTIAFLVLTAGILVGWWHAYLDVERGFEWVLDPVRNGSAVPWVACMILLHTLPAHWRPGRAEIWNSMLVAGTFLAAVLASVISRAGTVDGAHVFATSRGGGWVLGLVVAVTVTITTQVSRRGPPAARVARAGPRLGRVGRIGRTLAYGGGALLVSGLAGAGFATSHNAVLAPGSAYAVTDPFGEEWSFTSQGVSTHEHLNRGAIMLAVRAARRDASGAIVTSEQRQYFDTYGRESPDVTLIPAVVHSLRENVYLLFVDAPGAGRAVVRIEFHPLVQLVWWGGALLKLGTLLLLWPARDASHGDDATRAHA